MAADKMTEKVIQLMSNPKQIRNIAIAAHIDHGKCISGESKIILSNGEIVRADDLFNKSAKLGDKSFEDDKVLA